MELFGYKTQTTMWEDFEIADAFGADAVQETFNRVFPEMQSNYVYMTELVMVLNWRCWLHYEHGDHDRARLYERLFSEADQWCCENLHDEELEYFYNTTD